MDGCKDAFDRYYDDALLCSFNARDDGFIGSIIGESLDRLSDRLLEGPSNSFTDRFADLSVDE